MNAESATQTWTIETDSNGNTMYQGDPSWTSTPTGATPFIVSGQMFTPSFSGDDGTTLGVLGVWVHELPDGFSIRVTVRTSWLKPQNLQFIANEASYSKESITGGNRWTFSGTQARVSIYIDQEKIDRSMLDPMDLSSPADEDQYHIGFTVHHAGTTPQNSWWDPTCSDYGFTAQAFNSFSAGSPEWNLAEEYLEFEIFAPHLDSSGELNSGFFRLWVNEEFANCEWPNNTLVGAGSLEALIVNENGSLQEDANLVVTNENGMIYLDARNFHYSVPQFIIRPRTETSNPPVYTPPSAETLSQPRLQTSPSAAPVASLPKKTSSPAPSPSPSPSSEPEPEATEQLVTSPQRDDSTGAGSLIGIGLAGAAVAAVIGLELYRRRRSMTTSPRRK